MCFHQRVSVFSRDLTECVLVVVTAIVTTIFVSSVVID